MDSELAEKKNPSGEMQKYEILWQKDQEMTEFIDQYEETKNRELNDKNNLQMNIVRICEHIASQMKKENEMPTFNEAKDMEGDLKFKEGQLQNAVITYARLEKEKDMRKTDYEKIKLLDEKVISELEQLKTKINEMKKDLEGKFCSIDELRQDEQK